MADSSNVQHLDTNKFSSTIATWACGHFFRPLCLYSFYNLED